MENGNGMIFLKDGFYYGVDVESGNYKMLPPTETDLAYLKFKIHKKLKNIIVMIEKIEMSLIF